MVSTAVLEENGEYKAKKKEEIIGRENPKRPSHVKRFEVMRGIPHPEQDRSNKIAGDHEEQVDTDPTRAREAGDRRRTENMVSEHGEGGQCAQAVNLRNSLHRGERIVQERKRKQ